MTVYRPIDDWPAEMARLGANVPPRRERAAPRHRRILVPLLVGASDLFAVHHRGVDLGPLVYASTLRYFRAGRAELDDPRFVAKVREFLATASIMTEAVAAVLAGLRPDKVFMSHGVYATWGPWAALCRATNTRYATYSAGWRRNTLICQHDAPRAWHCEDLWPRWRELPLVPDERATIDGYLATREDNGADYFQYIDQLDRDRAAFLERHGLAGTSWKRTIGVFANVAYDAAQLRPPGVFADMFDWIVSVVRYAAGRPEVLFLVKVHPAESNFIEETPERWRVASVLAREVGALPANVRIVGAGDKVSPYTVYGLIDAGLVNTSSVGLEMAAAGLPVLTPAMGAHYDKPGIVLVPADRDDYFRLLDGLVDDPSVHRPDADLVRRYAYALYFRKSIPFEPLDLQRWAPLGIGIDSLAELAPGRLRGVDALCAGILDDAAFAFTPVSVPAEVRS